MKMKKGLLMVVFLLAMSSILAAMSYSSAKVTNAMTGKISTSDGALLTIRPADDHAAVKFVDGEMEIDFRKGRDADKWNFGMQKNSEYTWDNLFTVKNQSENKVYVTFNTATELPKGVKLSAKMDGDLDWTEFNTEGWIVNVAESRKIHLKVEVSGDAELSEEFAPNIVINAQAKR